MQYRVEERHIGAEPRRQMDVGLGRGWCPTRIDHDQLRRLWTTPAVEHSHPEHSVSARDVVAHMDNTICLVDVIIGAGLPVRSKGLLEGGRGSRRAKTRIAVHMRCAETSFADDGKG